MNHRQATLRALEALRHFAAQGDLTAVDAIAALTAGMVAERRKRDPNSPGAHRMRELRRRKTDPPEASQGASQAPSQSVSQEASQVVSQTPSQPSPLASPLPVSLSESFQLLTPSQQTQNACAREDVTKVYKHWLAVMGKDPARHKLTTDRRAKIVTRLRDHSADDLCAAIDGCKRSDFHMGAGGQAYNDLTTILKSASSVDQHIDRARGNGAAVQRKGAPAPVATAADWAEMEAEGG